MNVGEISFCDKVGFNINNNDVKKTILGDLETSYGIKIIARHYDRFTDERSIKTLNQNPHLICMRSNGNPYFLHLVKYNFTQYCIFIDKKIQQGYYYPRMILSRFSFDDSLFEGGGTLLEGEMIKSKDDNGTWYFVLSDMLVHAGNYLTDCNLPKRLGLIYKLLRNNHRPDASDVCQFRVKKYFGFDQFEAIKEHIGQLPYTTRGLVFRPLFLKFRDILYNFDDSLIVKVERKKVGQFVDRPLCDTPTLQSTPLPKTEKSEMPVEPGEKLFLVQKSSVPDVYNIFSPSAPSICEGTACIQGLQASKKMRALFADKNSVDKIEMRCTFIERFNKWAPII